MSGSTTLVRTCFNFELHLLYELNANVITACKSMRVNDRNNLLPQILVFPKWLIKVNLFTGSFTAGYPGDLSNAELYVLLLSTTNWNLARYNQSNPIKLNFSRTQSVRGKLWKEAEVFFFLDLPTTPRAPIIYPGITVYNLLFLQNTINNWFRNSCFFCKTGVEN